MNDIDFQPLDLDDIGYDDLKDIEFEAYIPTPPCPVLTKDEIVSCFSPRDIDSHKGTYGKLVIVCGSYGMIGAAVMAAKAALRCGVGLVHMVVSENCYCLMAPMLPQAVFTIINHIPYGDRQQLAGATQRLRKALHRATACVIGSGLGAQHSEWYLPHVVELAHCPVVIDADALRYLAQMPALTREHKKISFVLTPHPAEMTALTHQLPNGIQYKRVETAISCAAQYRAITVLKGAGTVIATPEGDAWQNPTGNPGMSKGGSGDVLAGMVGALLAQGFAPADAAKCAVYLHGWAGDLAAAALSQTAMLPTDLIESLPACFIEIEAALHQAPKSTP